MKLSTLLPTAILLPLSSTQNITLTPPYALRIHAPPPLNNLLLQTPDSKSYALSIYPSHSSQHANPWLFNVSNGYEISNDTTLMILLGEKVYMWDPEPASMQLFANPLSNAKTGYPGTQWPSVYISATWDFNITEDENGRWMLGHGFNHGMWITQPDRTHGEDLERWSLFWWNGTATYGVPGDYVLVSVKVVSAEDIGGDERRG